MTLFGLIRRNLRQRRLASILTTASVALGVMLVTAILLLRSEVEESFARPGKGYSLVVGPAKSDPLTLVLNTVFHLGTSQGFVPFRALTELEVDPSTRLAVPYAVGDSFRGYRVVATTDAVFSRHFPHPAGDTPEAKFSAGRPFRFDPHALEHALEDVKAAAARRSGMPTGDEHDHAHDHSKDVAEAVLGAEVARRLGLAVGATIEPTHGVEGGKEHDHEHLWTVSGILKPTGTPVDRLVFINLDSFYRIEDHAGGIIPETGEPGLSAIVLFPKPGFHKSSLLGRLSKRSDVQVAEVAINLKNFFDSITKVDRIFLFMALVTVVIGVVSVMVAIYNTMNERRREIAILRAIGAKPRTIVLTIVLEAALVSAVGAALGLALGHVLLGAMSEAVMEATRVLPDPWRLLPEEALVVLAVTLAGALAGLIPAIKAYRTDVATHLAPLS